MSSQIVAHPGDPVDAVRNVANTADIQSMIPQSNKDTFDVIELDTITAPTFSAPPYNLDTLTKYPVGNAGSLHVWGTSVATPGTLQFYVVLYKADGTLMSVHSATPVSLNTSNAQDTGNLYHSAEFADIWIGAAEQVGFWITAVSGGPWILFCRPY
jgi:hypothetical protein